MIEHKYRLRIVIFCLLVFIRSLRVGDSWRRGNKIHAYFLSGDIAWYFINLLLSSKPMHIFLQSIKKHPDKLEAPTQADYEVFEEITNVCVLHSG